MGIVPGQERHGSEDSSDRSDQIVIASAVSGAVLGWLMLIQIWILVLWYRPRRNPFARRLDQLLALLLPEREAVGRRPASALAHGPFGRLVGSSRLGRLKGSARRSRTQLRSMYALGYEAASETILPAGDVARGHALVHDTVAALRAERAGGGAKVPAREDPVVVFAYGLGAWPPSADLTSLEWLLAELGVSQPALLCRFESLFGRVATANPTREFRELAGASFVLGAAARILEAAVASDGGVPPPRFLSPPKIRLR
jgi:hypothetical protein